MCTDRGATRARVVLGCLAFGLALWGCSSSDATSQPVGDGGAAAEATNADILRMIQENNDRALSNNGLYCALCACGKFIDVSAAAEQCQVDVLGDFPSVREIVTASLECDSRKGERRASCLQSAQSCAAAGSCNAPPDGGTDDCDRFAAMRPEDVQAYTKALQDRCGNL